MTERDVEFNKFVFSRLPSSKSANNNPINNDSTSSTPPNPKPNPEELETLKENIKIQEELLIKSKQEAEEKKPSERLDSFVIPTPDPVVLKMFENTTFPSDRYYISRKQEIRRHNAAANHYSSNRKIISHLNSFIHRY